MMPAEPEDDLRPALSENDLEQSTIYVEQYSAGDEEYFESDDNVEGSKSDDNEENFITVNIESYTENDDNEEQPANEANEEYSYSHNDEYFENDDNEEYVVNNDNKEHSDNYEMEYIVNVVDVDNFENDDNEAIVEYIVSDNEYFENDDNLKHPAIGDNGEYFATEVIEDSENDEYQSSTDVVEDSVNDEQSSDEIIEDSVNDEQSSDEVIEDSEINEDRLNEYNEECLNKYNEERLNKYNEERLNKYNEEPSANETIVEYFISENGAYFKNDDNEKHSEYYDGEYLATEVIEDSVNDEEQLNDDNEEPPANAASEEYLDFDYEYFENDGNEEQAANDNNGEHCNNGDEEYLANEVIKNSENDEEQSANEVIEDSENDDEEYSYYGDQELSENDDNKEDSENDEGTDSESGDSMEGFPHDDSSSSSSSSSIINQDENEEFEFVAPPEAPVFHPTLEEFGDPVAYINKIRPKAEHIGICRIVPPESWQPPFTADVDNLKFTPRIQRINELEARTRIKLNFLDQIAKFWELQGSTLKIPLVHKKPLDLHTLYTLVTKEGGRETVNREQKWCAIATYMGFPPVTGNVLKLYYSNILYPYYIFTQLKSDEPVNYAVPTEPNCSQSVINENSTIKNAPVVIKSPTQDILHSIESKTNVDTTENNPNANTRENKLNPDITDSKLIVDSTKSKLIVDTTENEYNVDTTEGKSNFDTIEGKSNVNTTEGKSNIDTTESKYNVNSTEEDVEMTCESSMDIEPKTDLLETVQTNEIKQPQTDDAKPSCSGVRCVKTKKRVPDPLVKYICRNCNRGDMEDNMLLCDGCDNSYHMICLFPPLFATPKPDWRCPKCIAVEVYRPTEAFGFEQARREYTLQQFGEMADQFKSDYFNSPVYLVPTHAVEKEFWRIVSSVDEEVTVEYGADLHTMDHGSGFPIDQSKCEFPSDLEYLSSGWNLNNLPVLDGSVLGHINADISGMKIPWMYVGMCFSTFCWHNEDHWSYSINYLHWGEPKTWYGVPGSKAVEFEQTMKSAAPELFISQPDLLHQLVTIINPNVLMNAGVPVYRTDQHAGEIVITFPRAYHAGFNQGYNFAEAVNFAPADWVKFGRECVLHYSNLRRFCVFSHDELVCKMAVEPEKLSPLIAAATYEDMTVMVDIERKLRRTLLEWGVTKAEREAFELLPDDERQCEVCKTTCFLSAITCSCIPDALVCLRHYNELCRCPPDEHTLRYRYTLDELPRMIDKLKIKAKALDAWILKVTECLDPSTPSTVSLEELKSLLSEAETKKFPKDDLQIALTEAIDDATKCASVIRQIDITMARTRTRKYGERKCHLTFEELTLFVKEVDSLACVLVETKYIKNLLDQCNKFEEDSKKLLEIPLTESNIDDVQNYINYGETIYIELPSLISLHERLKQLMWLYELSINNDVYLTLEEIRRFIISAEDLKPHPHIENEILELHKLLSKAEEWEDRTQRKMKEVPVNSMEVYEKLLSETEDIRACLPSKQYLINSLEMIKSWRELVNSVNVGEFYPYIHIVENLIEKAKPITLPIKEIEDLKEYIATANDWKEKVKQMFLPKNSTITLMEALTPRSPFNIMVLSKMGKKSVDDDSQYQIDGEVSPVEIVDIHKKAEDEELDHLQLIRCINMSKICNVDLDYKFCLCKRKPFGVMMRCELCRDWYHSTCVNLPKIANYKIKGNFTKVAFQMGFKDCKFLCPHCCRTKRPRIEHIVNLLESLQKLPMRIPEGELLQILTERLMFWQDKVKISLKSDDFQAAMKKLSTLSQNISKITAAENMAVIEPKKSNVNINVEVVHDSVDGMPLANYINNRTASLANKTTAVTHKEHNLPSSEDMVNEHGYSLHLPNYEDYQCFINLRAESREKLENLLMEGDILEITSDETLQLWKLLQVSRDPQLDVVLVSYEMPHREMSVGIGHKRRFDDSNPRKRLKQYKIDTRKRFKPTVKYSKQQPGSSKTDYSEVYTTSSSDEDEIDERCAASTCLLPANQEVDWVQCDGGCEQWFHMVCVGLFAHDITEDEDYICIHCSQSGSAYNNSSVAQSPESSHSDNGFSVQPLHSEMQIEKESVTDN